MEVKTEFKPEIYSEYIKDENWLEQNILIKKEEKESIKCQDILKKVPENIQLLQPALVPHLPIRSQEMEGDSAVDIPPLVPNSELFSSTTKTKKKKSSISGPSAVLVSLFLKYQVSLVLKVLLWNL